MAKLNGLGHVAIHCYDLMKMRDFWTGVMGLEIADEDLEKLGICFLTTDNSYPLYEHHEFVLVKGRDVSREGVLVNQISFRVKSVDDLRWFHNRLKQKPDITIERQVSHGNALAFYFFDPEGNRIEVYYPTGFDVHSPHSQPIDLQDSPEKLLAFAKSAEGA